MWKTFYECLFFNDTIYVLLVLVLFVFFIFIMQKNYIQFLVLALIAVGMVMIAGIRSDVNSLESQLALTGRALVNKNTSVTDTEPATSNKVVAPYSLAQIEDFAKKFGLVKNTDGTYNPTSSSAGSTPAYTCPTCQEYGQGCCVVSTSGVSSSSSQECKGSFGTTTYLGFCSVAKKVSSTDTTTGGTSGSAERENRKCRRSEECPNPDICRGGFCVPCINSSTMDCTGRMTSGGTSSSNTQNALLRTTLKKGTLNSADVTLLQKMLIDLGFLTVTPSGNFLSMTEKAVKLFQSAYGISPVSGIAGELTRAKLNSMCTLNSSTNEVDCVIR